jgi:gamma-glutamyltranspeptidase/glutathione hydrolase
MAEGPRAFYEGEIAQAIVDKLGGAMTPADLAEFESEWVEPISTTYRGHEVHQIPPNAQGFAVLEMLNLLEGYELDPDDQWHLMVEAKKLAYADLERHNADPRFAEVPVERLISKAHAAALRERIDPRRASEAAGARVGGNDTIALVAADGAGDMVSLIYSVYTGFGSGLTVRGFALHDRGVLFSRPPNDPAPRKRPFHTLIPGFVTRDGAPLLAFGTPGGSAQPQTQLALLVNLIDHGMDVQAAIDAPRFVHDQATNAVGLEPELYERVGERLAALGHRVERSDPLGGLQAIRLDDGVYRAGSDRRKDGEVAFS